METTHIIELISGRYGLVPKDDWSRRLESTLQTMAEKPGADVNDIQLDSVLREYIAPLTIPESYFFRHPEQFRVLVEYVRHRLSDIHKDERIYFLSAGCAEGQEPYSIAMALADHFGPKELSKIVIFGSDINRHYIAKAKAGVFAKWSFRGMDENTIRRHFTRREDGLLEISQRIRDMVEFKCLSVQEHLNLFIPSWFDGVFFRNVGIYMNTEAQSGLYRRIRLVLRPGGLLFVSPSDMPPDKKHFVHHKDEAAAVYVADDPEVEDSPLSSRITATMMGRPFHDSIVAAAEAIIAESEELVDYLERGQAYMESGMYEEAAADFRQAVFLDEGDHIARYWYAFSLQQNDMPRRSLVQINHLIQKLAVIQPQTVLMHDGVTSAEELLRAAVELRNRIG